MNPPADMVYCTFTLAGHRLPHGAYTCGGSIFGRWQETARGPHPSEGFDASRNACFGRIGPHLLTHLLIHALHYMDLVFHIQLAALETELALSLFNVLAELTPRLLDTFSRSARPDPFR